MEALAGVEWGVSSSDSCSQVVPAPVARTPTQLNTIHYTLGNPYMARHLLTACSHSLLITRHPSSSCTQEGVCNTYHDWYTRE